MKSFLPWAMLFVLTYSFFLWAWVPVVIWASCLIVRYSWNSVGGGQVIEKLGICRCHVGTGIQVHLVTMFVNREIGVTMYCSITIERQWYVYDAMLLRKELVYMSRVCSLETVCGMCALIHAVTLCLSSVTVRGLTWEHFCELVPDY